MAEIEYTPNLALAKQPTGAREWGMVLNENFDKLDESIPRVGHYIGDIFSSFRPAMQFNGAVPCDGETYKISDFEGKGNIGELLRNGSLPVVSFEEYELQLKGEPSNLRFLGVCEFENGWLWNTRAGSGALPLTPKSENVFLLTTLGASWVFQTKVRTPADAATDQVIIGSSLGGNYAHGFTLGWGYTANKFSWWMAKTTAAWLFSQQESKNTFLPDTEYYIRLSWDGTTYRMEVSEDGIEWSEEVAYASTTAMVEPTAPIRFGSEMAAKPFLGRVCTAETWFAIDGEVKWQGGRGIIAAGACRSFAWDGGDEFRVPYVPGVNRVLVVQQAPNRKASDENLDYLWWNIYSDGWVEQGGFHYFTDAAVTFYWQRLPVRMLDTNYDLKVTQVFNTDATEGDSTVTTLPAGVTTTLIDFGRKEFEFRVSQFKATTMGFNWRVEGYAAEIPSREDWDYQDIVNINHFVQLATAVKEASIQDYVSQIESQVDSSLAEIQVAKLDSLEDISEAQKTALESVQAAGGVTIARWSRE